MNERMVTTYSMWRLFQNCRRAAHWRYVLEYVPIRKERSLSFGSLIHRSLEVWHGGKGLDAALSVIDQSCPGRGQDENQRQVWHLAAAMMRGYAARYPAEEFEVVALEKVFRGEIVNPETGATSRSFLIAGKVDGIVRVGKDHYLLEHKTASVVDGSYLERLWTDFQITLYAFYLQQALGIPIAGVLYNVLVKARLQQSQGETEEEFEQRRADLIAKSKSGKSSAKRRMPESDEEFQARLGTKYADPEMFHREPLLISREQFDSLRAELWELTQVFLGARRSDFWYQNPSFCFQYNRPCAYFALCRSGGSPLVLQNFYERRPPNEELRSEPSEEAEPVF